MSHYLTPKAREHWEWAQQDRARSNRTDQGCICPLCELMPALEEAFRKAEEQAWDKGFGRGETSGQREHPLNPWTENPHRGQS